MRHQTQSRRTGRLKWMAAALLTLWGGTGFSATKDAPPACQPTALEWQEARELDFNTGWKFFLGDTASASRPDFDDSAWRTLDLPHDWSIEGAPEASNPAGNDGGYYPTGIGWYRKAFDFKPDAEYPGTSVYFEGVYMNARVFLNGHDLGGRPYGYSSFFLDLTPYLKAGRNVIAVRVDNSAQKNCRWYTGSGIYRNVKLIRTPQVHFESWGVVVRAKADDPFNATAEVEATVTNRSGKDELITIEGRVQKPGSAQKAAGFSIQTKLEAGETRTVRIPQLSLGKPEYWSPDTPALYRLACSVKGSNGAADCTEETFGVRTVE